MSRPALDAQARRAVDEQLLQLLARQSRQVPYPVALSAVLIAGMAASHGAEVSTWVAGGWALTVLAVLALRWWWLRRLPLMGEIPLPRRLHGAVGLSALNGLVFGASLAFAPYLSDYQRMVQTILLLGLCAGSVATTAGHLPVLLAFMLPVSLANSLAWVVVGGGRAVTWVEWLLGGLILGFAWVLAGLARDANRVFVESVTIRLQQVASNQQLRLALQQAESAVQAKSRFLAAASHDLRQPMHTLSLFGAALMKRPLDPVSADIGRNMNLSVQSLAQQMDALLDISKLDAELVPVKEQVLAFSPWLARLCKELQPVAQGKGLSLSLDCPPGVVVESDPLLLDRVLRNLLDNAIKYTERGGVQVTVLRVDALWRVSIRDSGCGIASAEQPRVFDEFYQVGNPERDGARGLGLGLSIVNRLVDLLDLHLSLESVRGEGSTFSLSIAAADANTLVDASADAVSVGLPPQLQVLVIDDEAQVRLAMQALLGAHGCVVTVAGTTREALVKCLMRRPDIVLSDLSLRGGDDGISAVRSLRGALPGLPAVLISGDTSPERLRDAHGVGLVLLHKPVLEAQLLAAMQSALAGHRLVALEQNLPSARL